MKEEKTTLRSLKNAKLSEDDGVPFAEDWNNIIDELIQTKDVDFTDEFKLRLAKRRSNVWERELNRLSYYGSVDKKFKIEVEREKIHLKTDDQK
jgi:hypothetical protein